MGCVLRCGDGWHSVIRLAQIDGGGEMTRTYIEEELSGLNSRAVSAKKPFSDYGGAFDRSMQHHLM